MKKLFLLGALFAATLAVTSCSSDKDEAGGGERPMGNNESYLSFSLEMPSSASSRAANDAFNDGTAAEYQVNNATLVLFRGTSETDATALSAYDLTGSWSTSTETQISYTTQAVATINSSDKPTGTQKLYAYVILNRPANYAISAGQLTIDGTAISGTFEYCFGTEQTLSTARLLTPPFVMTNAPLALSSGGSSNPANANYSVLAQIDAAKIYSSRSLATTAGNEAATIHVERNVVKVTVGTNSSDMKVKTTDVTADIKDADDKEVAWSIAGWTLSNVAPTTYFQHRVNGIGTWYNYASEYVSENPYRFLGSSAVDAKYRIYWGESYEYNTDHTLLFATPAAATTGLATPLYCYENTFKTSKQRENYTTRAIIKLQINGGKDFYSLNGAYCGNATGDETPIKQAIAEMMAVEPTVAAAITFTADKTKATMTLTPAADGSVTVANVVLSDADGTNTYTVPEAVVSSFNAGNAINKYKDGLSYYSVMIKHFGDELTPWYANNHLTSATPYNSATTDPADEDGYSNANYLGRFGVLRNNWYNINVTKVADLGSPTIPAPGTDWDDHVKSYLSVKISVQAWVYRNQDEVL